MASLNEIAAQVINTLNQPFNHELNERVKSAIRALSATRIRQRVDKLGINTNFKISFVAELIEVDKADFCNIDTGCKILRTKNKIPSPINITNSSNFTFVGNADWVSFKYMPIQAAKHEKYLKFASPFGYSYTNNYIYVFFNRLLGQIIIEAIPENPEAYVSYCETGCVDDNMEYPLPLEMVDEIVTTLIKKFGSIKIEDNVVKTDEE